MKAALLVAALFLSSSFASPAELDLRVNTVVVPGPSSRLVDKAADFLREEMARRVQMPVMPKANAPSEGINFVLGTSAGLTAFGAEQGVPVPQLTKSEGFKVWVAGAKTNQVWIVGADEMGVMFGVGHLLRGMSIDRHRAVLPAEYSVETAPQKKLRGHQLGYRPKCNSYDGWDARQWEQYFRDLILFGCNAIELIPPRSDDDDTSPHFPLPQMEMMIEMSRIAAEYGLQVWIWYPAMDADYSDPKTVESALQEWGQVFAKLPRVDAVFVPGGDPGHTRPKFLFDLLEKQTAVLKRSHPKAAMWMSPQSFDAAWMEEFYGIMDKQPTWLSGIVYGPQVRVTLPELRAKVPARHPIRDYPDITHARHSQYFVPDWDVAFALTEGREPINPRPVAMRTIYRLTHGNTEGFITYSEGCNDDVNKMIWSALGWNENVDLNQVLKDYAGVFIGARQAEDFAKGLLMLEQNWSGPLETNRSIEKTLAHFQRLEKEANIPAKQNWRFQQALYRAYYDAFLQRRQRYENELEARALAALKGEGPVTDVLKRSELILRQATEAPVAQDLRAKVFELAEALFQSIHMQLSVPRYQAIAIERGANLDGIDVALNSRRWLIKEFDAIRELASEQEQRSRIASILNRTDPGPGGFYDDLGNPAKQPHLVRKKSAEDDPGALKSHLVSFIRDPNSSWPKPWWTWAEPLYDQSLQMRYTDLDRNAHYTLRIVYGRERQPAKIRLMANGTVRVHDYLSRPFEVLEFDLPPETTREGKLELTWNQASGNAGTGRGCQVAEVWLVRQTP